MLPRLLYLSFRELSKNTSCVHCWVRTVGQAGSTRVVTFEQTLGRGGGGARAQPGASRKLLCRVVSWVNSGGNQVAWVHAGQSLVSHWT